MSADRKEVVDLLDLMGQTGPCSLCKREAGVIRISSGMICRECVRQVELKISTLKALEKGMQNAAK